jgi:hypothetical protein
MKGEVVPRPTIPALLSAKRLALTLCNWGSTIVAASSGSLGFAVVRACSNAAHPRGRRSARRQTSGRGLWRLPGYLSS